MSGDPAQVTIGSHWSYGPHVYEVRALKPIDDPAAGASARMVLATPLGEPPHPFDWVPESSFCREWTPVLPTGP
jgi:hypothetical protein